MTVICAPAPALGVDLTEQVTTILTDTTLIRAHRQLQRKAAVIVAWYVASYAAVLAAPNVPVGVAACVSLAFAFAAVGFNIQHDANHNALFFTNGRKKLSGPNRLAGLSLNMIGGDADRWLAGHVRRHHSAPNVAGRDDDIDLAPFGRLAPTQPWRPWYRYQHLYLWPLYSVTAVAIFVTDVTATISELVRVRRDRADSGPGATAGFGVLARMLAAKTAFLTVMVGVPLAFHTPAAVVGGAALVAAVAGMLLGVVFQLAHTVEQAEFRDVGDPPGGRWHEWQIRSTVDFCHGTGPAHRALTWMIGGLNYQVEHHLFPSVPHTAYPELVGAVADTCQRHGLDHHVQPTLRTALRSHHRHLREMGRRPA